MGGFGGQGGVEALEVLVVSPDEVDRRGVYRISRYASLYSKTRIDSSLYDAELVLGQFKLHVNS